MFSIEAGSWKVIVNMMYLKSFERIEVIFGPFPGTTRRVVMSCFGRGKEIHWILRRIGEIQIGTSGSFNEVSTRVYHDLVCIHILPTCF